MASRANKQNRPDEEIPTYGAPLGPATPKPERERERQEKLKKKPTAEERRKLLEEHERRGEEESARRRQEREAEARRPAKPVRTIGPPTGRPTIDIIGERGRDIETEVEEAETGEEQPTKRAPEPETEPTMPTRKRKRK